MTVVVRMGVLVIDGECIPVPDVEVGARFKYSDRASTWCSVQTDGDGMAWFRDEHLELPLQVDLYAGHLLYDTFPVADGTTLVLEV